MRTKKLFIEGVFHPVCVQLISEKKLNAMYADEGEELMGFYDSTKNSIFVSNDLEESLRLHTFFHELSHYIDAQTRGLKEEARCDVLGSYLMRLMQASTVEEFLDKRKTKIVKEKTK